MKEKDNSELDALINACLDGRMSEAEADRLRREGRTKRVETNLEGKARHTILEEEAFTAAKEGEGEEEAQGYFFYTAPETEQEKKQEQEKRIAQVFREDDTSGEGTIARPRLERVLRSLCPSFTDGEISCLFRQVEKAEERHQGMIRYDEFLAYVFATATEETEKGKENEKKDHRRQLVNTTLKTGTS